MADLPEPADQPDEPPPPDDRGSGSTVPGTPDELGTPDEPDEPDAPVSLGEVVATARDIVLYAPIALVLDAPTLLPKLAEQGKVHMRNAKALGPHALRKIQNRLAATADIVGGQATELLRQFGVTAEPIGESDGGPASRHRAGSGPRSGDGLRADGRRNGTGPVVDDPATVAAEATPPSPAVGELAIPDYDSLSALQVVDRLPGLAPDELEAVRAYEAAHRGRKTILNKAAQLQAPA